MKALRELFASRFGGEADSVIAISASGSNRRYFRMTADGVSCIGAIGTDIAENKAFVAEAEHFRNVGLPVPEVLAVADDFSCYIQEDLGDASLYDLVAAGHKSGAIPGPVAELLRTTVSLLPELQFEGARGLDFSVCYPEPSFSRRMVMFDLNYFKYCFLKPSGLEFNEVLLQDDLEKFADDLMAAGVLRDASGRCFEGETFMYRDFQSRNVMVKDGQPYFIDFQGGRRGPVHYDLASFVWHARSAYPASLKKELTDTYLRALGEYVDVDVEEFMLTLRRFVLFRTLQVLGAYGFRGWVEQKAKFVTSIPAAVAALKEQTDECADEIRETYPYLYQILADLTTLPRLAHETLYEGLTVTVYSFSFHKGLPHDPSGNGGGYVFDCRSIHNPGRYVPYKKLTGRDEEVIRFLEEDGEVFSFLDHVYGVVDPHVETFSRRGFTNLMVSFGCTGGQHRSVYCAEHLARHLAERFPAVRVRLIHREQGMEETL